MNEQIRNNPNKSEYKKMKTHNNNDKFSQIKQKSKNENK